MISDKESLRVKPMFLPGEIREAHCLFAELNSAGRCVASCHYNHFYNYKRDCTGRTGVHHSEVGQEVKLNMRGKI